MLTTIDHILVATGDLASAVDRFCALLGREPAWRDPEPAPSRVRFQLGNVALDIVPDVIGEAGETREHRSRLAIGFATPDLAKARHRLERVGIPTSDSPTRLATVDSVRRNCEVAALLSAATHGQALMVVERNSDAMPPSRLNCDADAAVSGLDHVVITTSHPERAAALYGARLGLEMKLDRTNPAWGARLMFFKCGDSIVEIAHSLKSDPDAPDQAWGLSWRVTDVVPANARMALAGFSVSEVHTGRKPGTLVFTVRDAPAEIPTLVLGAAG